jgi:hypothetical protein
MFLPDYALSELSLLDNQLNSIFVTFCHILFSFCFHFFAFFPVAFFVTEKKKLTIKLTNYPSISSPTPDPHYN